MSSRCWLPTWLRRRRTRPSPTPEDWTGAIVLGSERVIADLGIGPKAALLDRAARAAISVPTGFVVPHELIAEALQIPDWMAAGSTRRWAVRSAFSVEDDPAASLAGWFTSLLNVDDGGVGEAITTVRASASRRAGDFRRDVLVMEMVDAQHAGVAFSEPGTYDDLVNVADGLADDLVSGTEAGDRRELPRLESVEEGWPTRLRALLRAVRAEFGDEPWDIEWADDGSTCWLVQIRPISAPPLRNETLTAANHAEILPELPSHLMTSIVAEAGPDLFEWYRRRVPGLPTTRDFLHVVHGRPMINLSLLEDMLRHLGLPTTLVAESIGGGAANNHPVAPARIVRHFPSLLRLGWSQIMAVALGARHRRRAAEIGARPAAGFAEAIDDLHRAYVALVTGMFPLSSAIGPPMAVLRATGTLYEHAARHRTITADLADRREAILRQPTDQRTEAVESFLHEFGHRGVYESDISRPRYRDDLSTLGADGVAHPADTSTTDARPRRTLRGVLTWPVWAVVAQPMGARELLRHESMRSFASIRSSLVALADVAVRAGQLSVRDDLWDLTADEARRLDTGWVPDEAFWVARRIERAAFADLDVPHVVGMLDDPSQWNDDLDQSDALRGLPLTAGSVRGRAWVLSEPEAVLPEGFDRKSTVLVARSIDAGWISTIGLVAAVVVEIGGDLSHGSILVRELGVPAITNVAGATRRVDTGDALVVEAGSGLVRFDEHAGAQSDHPTAGSGPV